MPLTVKLPEMETSLLTLKLSKEARPEMVGAEIVGEEMVGELKVLIF